MMLNPFSDVELRYLWISVNSRTMRDRVWAMLDDRGQSREDIGSQDGVLRTIVCMLLNFAAGDPRAPTLIEKVWTLQNIRERASDWVSGAHHPDHVVLSNDLDELISHPEFLRAHGVPSNIRVLSNGTLEVESANFDEVFGTNACLTVLDHLEAGGDEDTGPLRRAWESSLDDGQSPLIAALPTIGPRIGVPSMFCGTVLTGDTIFNLELLTLLEFDSFPLLGQTVSSVMEIPFAGPLMLVLGLLSTLLRFLPVDQS